MNVYSFRVPAQTAGARLYPLTRRMLPELPDYALREAFQKRDVKMDGARVGRDAEALPGAEVLVYTRHGDAASLPKIIYVDENVLIVQKPAGVSCEPDAKGGKTIAQLAAQALRQTQPEAEEPLLCHRLDNQTEGLLVLARSESVQGELFSAFKEHRVRKEYVCLVKGAPDPAHRLLEAYLWKDAEKAKVRVVGRPQPGALPIVTEYTVLEAGPEVSRLKVRLHTGRTHQIRAQMAAVGHPLLGDDLYGDRALNRAQKAKRLMLCATELGFACTGPLAYLNEKQFHIEAPF